MQQAHTKDPALQFIRGIRTTPDPAIVLAFDFQLDDLVRFCATQFSGEFCVFTIDPTLSLGDFDVTLIVTCFLKPEEANHIQYFWGQCSFIIERRLVPISSLLQHL